MYALCWIKNYFISIQIQVKVTALHTLFAWILVTTLVSKQQRIRLFVFILISIIVLHLHSYWVDMIYQSEISIPNGLVTERTT